LGSAGLDDRTIVAGAIILEEVEDARPLHQRASPMRHPQDDIAIGPRQIGSRPLVVEGQGMEFQE
jgi:hypothetical protein